MGLNYVCMIVCTDEGFKEKMHFLIGKKKIRPHTSKDEHCQAAYLVCLERGHTLELEGSSCILSNN